MTKNSSTSLFLLISHVACCSLLNLNMLNSNFGIYIFLPFQAYNFCHIWYLDLFTFTVRTIPQKFHLILHSVKCKLLIFLHFSALVTFLTSHSLTNYFHENPLPFDCLYQHSNFQSFKLLSCHSNRIKTQLYIPKAACKPYSYPSKSHLADYTL